MAKAELGTKRRCLNCTASFFDLNRTPVICPKCNAAFQIVEYAHSRAKWTPSPSITIKKAAPTDPIVSDLVMPEVDDTESTVPPIDEDDDIKLEENIEVERDGVADV